MSTTPLHTIIALTGLTIFFGTVIGHLSYLYFSGNLTYFIIVFEGSILFLVSGCLTYFICIGFYTLYNHFDKVVKEKIELEKNKEV
jgi:hypothetical protein